MFLCGGDVSQYNELKKISVGEYIIKLDDYISRIEK